MTRSKTLAMRSSSLSIAVLFFAATVLLSLVSTLTSRAALLTSRSIQMSSSAVSAASTTYNVSFVTPAASFQMRGIVVDFCSESPLEGDTSCSLAGFSLTGTPTVNQTAGITGWTAGTLNSNRTLTLTDATGITASSTTVTFDITTVTNPSANGTFYARIYTYDLVAGATSYTVADPDAGDPNIDFGGIAMSTASQLTVTAKVQERLTFCVYTSGANCAGGSGSSISIGGSSNNDVLDDTQDYVDKNAKFGISTNATSNAIVRMKGTTLTSGGNTITAIGGAAASSSAGSEQFGVCFYQSSGSGMTLTAPYNNASCNTTTQGAAGAGSAQFGFDDSGSGTTSTYGDDIATKPAGTESQGTMAFVGNIASTTEAGIYTTTLTFIATGVY